jgi:hypothetical protein
MGGILTKLGQALQQIGQLGVVSGLSQRLDQVIKSSLVLWIAVQSLPTMLSGSLVFSGLQIQLRSTSCAATSVGSNAIALVAQCTAV